MAAIAVDPEVFHQFILYGTLILLKVYAMAPCTAWQRKKHMTVHNKQDAGGLGKNTKVGENDDIENVRRAHLNDLENAVPFVLLAFIYCFTGPAYSTAVLHFRVFTLARYFYTFFFVNRYRHSIRGTAWAISFLTAVSMGVRCLLFALAN